MQIDEANLDLALGLLARGMPERSRAFWETGFARLQAHGQNRELGVPLGRYLMHKDRPVGLILTIATERCRAGPDPGRNVINLSSLYIETEHRWRTPLMLRQAASDPRYAYTSLTPIPSVAKLLASIGFVPANAGVAITSIVLTALAPGSRGSVHGIDALPPAVTAALGPERLQLMQRHAALGCVVVAAPSGGGWQPLILKPRRLRGMPALRLVYCEALGAAHRILPALCRLLLRRGWAFLIMEQLLDGPPSPGYVRRGAGITYIKGPGIVDAIDHAGSELVIFDF
jgi:hypothetical protein